MTALPSPISPSPLRSQSFLCCLLARSLSELSCQIVAVAAGWQIYSLTNSAFDLGMVGLAQFLPSALLVFVAGQAADRYDRRRVAQVCQVLGGITASLLALGSVGGRGNVSALFVAVAALGAVLAFEQPATAAMLPGVVAEGLLSRATALSTAAFQAAMIVGPTLGGFAYAVSPALPCALAATFWFASAMLNGAVRLESPVRVEQRPTFQDLFAGARFIRREPAILGTISLDLFAVLLGGATALLPIYTRDILHTGPWGLGLLRGASAIGALLMATVLARRGIQRKAGLRMFQAVIVFGLATLAFAVSRFLWLSFLALAIMGAADMVSMVIRIALVQLRTPDGMRGRVGAVNFLFVNASAQLGEFESGLTAALFGAMPAAAIGGLGTILVALLWLKFFPTLRNVDRLE